MGYRHFSFGLLWRVVLMTLTALGTGWLGARGASVGWLLALGVGLNAAQGAGLYHYVVSTNRKLTRFLESVRFSDFAISFRADRELGPSFEAVNQQFNEVLEAFRLARAEKEANLHYLNTLVQHVNVGLLAYDVVGNVELVNQAALRLLGVYRLRKLTDLATAHPDLLTMLTTPRKETTGDTPVVYRTAAESAPSQELSVRSTAIRLRGRLITLISLQNIRNELQQKEAEAWQNLTKVLRHEIMNSLTPVVSLVGTMQEIVSSELRDGLAPTASVDDLEEALRTIEQRGRGIMRFVEAYRHFTTLPQPRFAELSVAEWLHRAVSLSLPELRQRGIALDLGEVSPNLKLQADADQLDMVLLNLIRNAAESVEKLEQPRIYLEAQGLADQGLRIRVSDNGPGIAPEALEKVFIPFYTTKKTGSGIGLSLSRQIVHLHGGSISIASEKEGCTVELLFARREAW